MKKELFNEIFGLMKKLDIPFNIGTRTNVKKMPNVRDLTTNTISERLLKGHVEADGVSKVLQMFERDGAYIPTLNDQQGTLFLGNLKILDKIVNPPTPKSAEVHLFSKLPGEKMTPEQYAGQKAADEEKIQTALLNQAMKVSSVDRTLAKRLNLDMSKMSDWEKLQVWKDKHGVPDWAKDSQEGLGSLFKVAREDPLADVGTILDNIEKEGKSIVDQMKKITDLAYRMSPEGRAAEETARKALLKRMNEGKGFAGGVFGHRNDGYFRAVVRPFLIDQHEKGVIKIADDTLTSLKQMDDLKGGGDFMSADPVRIFRQHYGDDAFDLIPDQEAFGMGPTGYGPTSEERINVLNKVIGKPIMVQGPRTPGGYLTKGEYQAKIDEVDEVRGYIQRREGRFGDMSEKEINEEIAQLANKELNLKNTMDKYYPPQTTPEVSGMDDTFKSDFEKLAFDPVTKATVGKNIAGGFKGKKKDSLGIRLMKNYDQDLTDEGLAQEGYNLQEIDILKRARAVMKDPEKDVRHPTEALRWVRGDMADEAGVDIDDFMTTFNWDDTYSLGGGVGSMFRRV